VGTKVLDKLRASVKVADYCDTSSVGTITCVKSLETFVSVFLPPYPNLGYSNRLSDACAPSDTPALSYPVPR
jgi:hypothetical protein